MNSGTAVDSGDPVMAGNAVDLTLERFDYSRLGANWAVLRLLARLGSELGAPAAAQLVVRRGSDDTWVYPACLCSLERRLPGRERSGGSELLWRASFAIPLEIVTLGQTLFTLTTGGGVRLDLPAPGVRIVSARRLALAPIRYRQPSARRSGMGLPRRRIVALATAVAVSATSTPAAALADGLSSSAPVAIALSTTAATTSRTASATPPAGAAQPASGSHRRAASAGSTRTGSHSATPLARVTRTRVVHLFTRPASRQHNLAARRRPALRACTTDTRTGAPAIAARHAHPTAPQHHTSGTVAVRIRCAIPAPRATHKFSKTGRRHHVSGTRPGQQGATLSIGPTVPPGGRPKRTPRGANGNSTTPSGRHGKPTASGRKHRPAPASHHRGRRRLSAAANRDGGAPLSRLSKHPAHKPPSEPNSTGAVTTLSGSPAGFLAPRAWTGTVTADPALTGAVTDLSGLLSNGNRPPSFLIPIYMQAGHRYGVPWEVLAAINAIESDYGRNLSTSSAGAYGWMQFEPSTWREYGVAADGHSIPNPYDPRDAIFSAARYLAAAGAAQNVPRAVYAYNHANWYVSEVLTRAQAIATHVQYERQTVRHGVFSVYFATGDRRRPTVRYRGGVLSHYDRLIASANMVSAADFPYLYGGGHEQPARFGPFDCSGSVSYVMQQAGYKVLTTVSGEVPIWKFPAGPGRVTIFYNPGHTFMRIGNRYFGTSGFARPGGGAGWFNVDKLPADYLAQFREVHVPRLGVNSFAPARTPRRAHR